MNIPRIRRDEAVLVAIDFQEKLVPAMRHAEKLTAAMVKLASGLRVLGVPCIVTQQYTKGLGETVPEIREALGEFEPVDKKSFSACANEEFAEKLVSYAAEGRKTIILAGIETHICLEQTALDLMQQGYDVFVAGDCVDSRDSQNRKLSLRRLEQAGAIITCGESILYELLGSAAAPEFKAISAIVK